MITSLAAAAAGVFFVLTPPPPHAHVVEQPNAQDAMLQGQHNLLRHAESMVAATRGECEISADGVRTWQSTGDFLVIDLRPRTEFDRIRIPGSLNLPARELKTKRYFTNRRLLLLDRGYRLHELDVVCRSLRDSGFRSVQVLAGGVEAWRRHIAPLAGDRWAETALNRISPEALEASLRYGNWTVVDVSETGAAREQFQAPTHVPFEGGRAHFVERLMKAVAGKQSRQNAFVLLVDRDSKRYEALKQAIGPDWPESLYFLDGGVEAYRAARARHAAMVAAGERLGCPECGR